MASFDGQFSGIVQRWRTRARAFLCDGDPRSAVIWDQRSHITVRLQLIQDEVWVIAGSGMLVRFVAASDGEFDREGIDDVVGQILAGKAVEYFGAADRDGEDVIATGYSVGEEPVLFTGGLGQSQSRFRSRIAGPMAVRGLDYLE